jgi:hypothetical protein
MRRLAPSPFVHSTLHGGRTILLDLRRERYYGLDDVGTRVWALLKEGVDVPAIVARLGEEYDAPRERLQADVSQVLRHLAELKVIIPAGAQRNGTRSAARAHRVVKLVHPGPLRGPSGLSCSFALVGATLALRVLGLRRSLALIRRLCWRAQRVRRPTPEFLAAVVRKVDTAAAFFPGRAQCLERSLALCLCLWRAGVPVELRMGVQPYPFAAHAWVDYLGEPVGESWDRVNRFVPFGDLEGC